jgi:hypothetical protein
MLRRDRGLLLALVVLGLTIAGSSAAPPTTGNAPRYHQGEGDRARYALSATITATGLVNEAKTGRASFSFDTSCAVEFVGATPDGVMRVQAELAPCSVTIKSQGKPRTARMEGASMAYDVTSRGLVQTAELLSAEPPLVPELGIIVTPDDAFLVSAVGVLPTKPLQAGDKWHGTVALPSLSEPGAVVSAAYDSKVLGRVAYAGRSCWRITTKLRSSREESQSASCGRWNAHAKLTQTGTKEWLFEPEAGLVMKMDGKDTLVISLLLEDVVEGQNEAKLTATIQSHSRLTELNGEKIAAK